MVKNANEHANGAQLGAYPLIFFFSFFIYGKFLQLQSAQKYRKIKKYIEIHKIHRPNHPYKFRKGAIRMPP